MAWQTTEIETEEAREVRAPQVDEGERGNIISALFKQLLHWLNT